MKQWIARILAVAMVVSLLSVSAFAADYTTIDPSNFNTTVGDTPTITQDGDTVTITASYGVSLIVEGVVSFVLAQKVLDRLGSDNLRDVKERYEKLG